MWSALGKVAPDKHLSGLSGEGTRPNILVSNGDIWIHAEEGNLGFAGGTQHSGILMQPGSVSIEGGYDGSSIVMDKDKIGIRRNNMQITIDKKSLRLGTNADDNINPATPGQCMVMITNNAVEATGKTIRIQTKDVVATLGVRGAMVGSEKDYIRLRNDQGISINGRRLNLDADSYLYLG